MSTYLVLPHQFAGTRVKAFLLLPVLQFTMVIICFSQTKTGTNTADKKPAAKVGFVMCEVLPGSEVASRSPFTVPLVSAEPVSEQTIKTGCVYKFKRDDDEGSISISLTDLGSSKNALTSYKNAWQASKDLWEETPASAIVLQDTGFFSGKDECGLKWHLGKYILDINFKGQFTDVSNQQKKEAGIILAEMVMDRLKYLWQGKDK